MVPVLRLTAGEPRSSRVGHRVQRGMKCKARRARTGHVLSAAVSLVRLWPQQEQRAEASARLASIYGWCTEGFDTADLQEAKALLEELGA